MRQVSGVSSISGEGSGWLKTKQVVSSRLAAVLVPFLSSPGLPFLSSGDKKPVAPKPERLMQVIDSMVIIFFKILRVQRLEFNQTMQLFIPLGGNKLSTFWQFLRI